MESRDSKIKRFSVRLCNSSNAVTPIDTENPLPLEPTAFGQLRAKRSRLRAEFMIVDGECLKRCHPDQEHEYAEPDFHGQPSGGLV
jgi:hypothetical protein